MPSAVTLARAWGVSSLVVGLTLVASGASSPELATRPVAALRRQAGIVLGNIVGSNIFNVLGLLPWPIPSGRPGRPSGLSFWS